MCAKTAWAWCSPRSNRRIKRSWKNGWPTFGTNTNALRARGSFPDKFSIRGNGAVERTRTSTVLLPPAPQAGASASSATTAFHRLADYSGEPRELRGSLANFADGAARKPRVLPRPSNHPTLIVVLRATHAKYLHMR